VSVPRYKLSLCHTSIKPDLLGFLGIGIFAYGLHDRMFTRYASGRLGLNRKQTVVVGQSGLIMRILWRVLMILVVVVLRMRP